MNRAKKKMEDGKRQPSSNSYPRPSTTSRQASSMAMRWPRANREMRGEGGVSPHTAQLENIPSGKERVARSPLSSGALDQKVRPGTGRLETFFPPGGRKQRSTVAGRSQALVQCCSRRSLCIVFIPRRTLLQFCILAAKGARPHRSSFRNRFTSAVLQCQC